MKYLTCVPSVLDHNKNHHPTQNPTDTFAERISKWNITEKFYETRNWFLFLFPEAHKRAPTQQEVAVGCRIAKVFPIISHINVVQGIKMVDIAYIRTHATSSKPDGWLSPTKTHCTNQLRHSFVDLNMQILFCFPYDNFYNSIMKIDVLIRLTIQNENKHSECVSSRTKIKRKPISHWYREAQKHGKTFHFHCHLLHEFHWTDLHRYHCGMVLFYL